MGKWLPKSVVCLKSYTPRLFESDLLAGSTVGLVALPLAMAFAIASAAPPQAGLYCAIVAGFARSPLLEALQRRSAAPLGRSWLSYLELLRDTVSTGCSCAP